MNANQNACKNHNNMFEQISALIQSGHAKIGKTGFSLPMGLNADYDRFTYAELRELSKSMTPDQKAELTANISKLDADMARRLDNYFMGKEENAAETGWPEKDWPENNGEFDYNDDIECECPDCLLERGDITEEHYNRLMKSDTTMPDMPIVLNVNIVLPNGEVLRSKGNIPADKGAMRPEQADVRRLADMTVNELQKLLTEKEGEEKYEYCRAIQNEIDKKLKE